MARREWSWRRAWPAGAVAALLLALAATPAPAAPETLTPQEGYGLVASLLSPDRKARRQAAKRLTEAADRSLVPAMADAVFFAPRHLRGELLGVLEALTGERHERYYDWVEYVGGREDLEPKEGYLEWKRLLLARIDEEYKKVFYLGAPHRIRLEEIVSGGVPLAGIPALDRPPVMPAEEAGYLRDGEQVFGVFAGGEARAYPLRILSWHELLNDELGGVPVTLSFCTLCGSGIAYDASTPAGGAYTFDTSGLLYRSNKLMVDRQTWSLWSNLTGEPVVGRLAASRIELPVLPTTLTTWEDWRERHPRSSVLDQKAIERELGGRYRFDYRPGAADRARQGVRFPVWLKSDRLERDEEVFALRLGGAAKAYPLELVLERGVVNDELGSEPLVLVADAASGAVRAYRRGERTFAAAEGGGLIDERGIAWRVGELALQAAGGTSEETRLERLPGHVAFWFGWFAFYPQTEVFGQDEP